MNEYMVTRKKIKKLRTSTTTTKKEYIVGLFRTQNGGNSRNFVTRTHIVAVQNVVNLATIFCRLRKEIQIAEISFPAR